MLLNKGKSAAPRRRQLQCYEGPHQNVVPHSNGEKRPRLPENNKTSFMMGQQEVGIRLYRHRASRNSLKRGFSYLAMLDSLQSFCGLRHKHCLLRVMARSCVKYRLPGTEERTCILSPPEHAWALRSFDRFLSVPWHDAIQTHQITIHASVHLQLPQLSMQRL